eukprot:5784567-Amphidinium_carterae.1
MPSCKPTHSKVAPGKKIRIKSSPTDRRLHRELSEQPTLMYGYTQKKLHCQRVHSNNVPA